jgi:endonuclease YncB( thermonuclease family)
MMTMRTSRAKGLPLPGLRARALLLGLVIAMGFPSLAAQKILAGRASVLDGDTIEIRGERIRLFGIDAPESGQMCLDAKGQSYRCGQKAALVLDARIGEGVVTCERKDTDRYGRVVALCRVYGEDLSAWMVGLGWALAYRTYTTRYVPAEDLARSRGLGMWAGRFTPPWDWRTDRRRAAPAEP